MNSIYRSPDVAEANETAEDQVAPAEVTDEVAELPEEILDVEINGVPDKVVLSTIKKGRGKGNSLAEIRIDPKSPNPFANLVKMVGVENWNTCIVKDFLHPIFLEVTKDAIDDDGEFSLQRFADAFRSEFLPSTRGGSKKKELQKKVLSLGAEAAPYMLLVSQGKQIPEVDLPRFRELMLEYSEATAELEVAERKGKKK